MDVHVHRAVGLGVPQTYRCLSTDQMGARFLCCRRMVTNNMSGPLPRLLLAAAVAVTLVLMSPVNGQKLPTRDEDHFQFHISHAEIFYDTKLLPDGAEVMSYLLRGVWRRYVDWLYRPTVVLAIKICFKSISFNLSEKKSQGKSVLIRQTIYFDPPT